MKLESVSKKNVTQYFKTHYDNGKNLYNRNAKIIQNLIVDYPSHNLIQHVLPKAIVINQLYNTNIFAIDKMADHITKIDITDKIKMGDINVISDISTGHGIRSKKNKTEFEFYSFATKYAWCHNPSSFIIYDYNVDCILWEYRKLRNSFKKFPRKDLKEYQKYKEIVAIFKNFYNIDDIDNNLLDKFFWRQGDLFLRKKRKAKEAAKKRALMESFK